MDWKAVQKRLLGLGYNPGPIDGIWGRKTRAAVIAFQKDAGLDPDGIVGPITLAALDFEPAEMGDHLPPWLVEIGRKRGLHEKSDNAELRAYLKSDGQTLGDPAKLPWCGDLIETAIALTLPDEILPTNPYWARNWLKFGIIVPQDAPVLGAIGISSRGQGGHVYTIDGHDRTHWHGVGGNQGNSISKVLIAKSRTLGLRYPKTWPMPAGVLPYSTFNGRISTNEA